MGDMTEYTVGKFADLTTLLTNYPELNIQMKEGMLEKMLGRARSDECIQQLMASKAIVAASSKKKDVTAVVSKGLDITNSPSKRDKEQIKARGLGGLCKLAKT